MRALVTCMVAGIQYLVHPQKLGSIQETINPDALLPITLLTTDEIFGDLDGVLQLLDSYDDVFNPDFGAVLVEKPDYDSANLSSYVSVEMDKSSRQVYHLSDVMALSDEIAELPSGPYFLQGPNLHQAWRLYDDELEAFTFGVVPENVTDPDEFEVVNALSPEGNFKTIPVPSRLYHGRPSSRKPLSGFRISISDSLSLNGVPTTWSSRAWSSLYTSAPNTTTDYVQKLLDLGATVVGKTKTTQFGWLGRSGEWVDEQEPWNPRGDGYQRMSGSSPGAAAALMGYEWMDHAVGDSVIANQEGLYSITLNRVALYGHGKRKFGPGNILLLSRSLEALAHLTSHSGDFDNPYTKFPRKILYPMDLTSNIPLDQKRLMMKFIGVLEKFLDGKAKPINLEESWATWADGHKPNLQIYLKDAFDITNSFEYCRLFEDFHAEYVQKFGREPYFETTPRWLWDSGKNIADDVYGDQDNRMLEFRSWVETYVMPLLEPHLSDDIMVLPCTSPIVQYRDDLSKPPTAFEGLTLETIGQILWTTQLTVPFAQIPYESRITGGTEYLPFCASILGFRKSELMLVKLIKQAFEAAKWPVHVETGRFTFPLKDSSMLVQEVPGEL